MSKELEDSKLAVSKQITAARQKLLILTNNMNLSEVDPQRRFMDCFNAMTEVNKLAENINDLSILYARMIQPS